MPIPGLTDEENEAVIAALKKLIVDDNSQSPRLDPYKSALAKLDPPTPKATPPQTPIAGASVAAIRRRKG
jgi:hypothetical protein